MLIANALLIVLGVVALIVLVLLFFVARFFALWVQALFARAKVGLGNLSV